MVQSAHIISDSEVAKPSTNIGQHTRALNLYPLALALSRKQGVKSKQQIEIERLYLSAGHYHNDGKTIYTSMQDLCANAGNLTYGGQIFVKLYKLFYLRQPDVIVSKKTGELRAVFLPDTFMRDVQTHLKRKAAPFVKDALDHPDLTPHAEAGIAADKSVKVLTTQTNLYGPDALAVRTSLTLLFNWFESVDDTQSENLSRSVLRALLFIIEQTKAAGVRADLYDNDFSFESLFHSASAAMRKLAFMAQENDATRVALQNIMISMRLDTQVAHRFHAMGFMAILDRSLLEMPVDIALFLDRMAAIRLKHNSFYQLDMDLGDLHVDVSDDGTIPYDQKAREYGDFLIRYVREVVILSAIIT